MLKNICLEGQPLLTTLPGFHDFKILVFLGHLSLRPPFRAHGSPGAARRLRVRRGRPLHGTDDTPGLATNSIFFC